MVILQQFCWRRKSFQVPLPLDCVGAPSLPKLTIYMRHLHSLKKEDSDSELMK